MEPDESYDAIVCRHLVWTLTQATLEEWFRLLKPGGKLLVFDGDWARPTTLGRLATWTIRQIDRVIGPDNHYDGALSDRDATIMQNLPFGDGLTMKALLPMLKAAGFETIEQTPHQPIAAAQRKTANLRNCLRTFVYRRFILCAHKPV
ncbi:hypothetical protein BC360_18890 [Ensifer sp. LC163]|nr:hypothetical protein BC360_18890 [Ensifer sp. LC163]